MLRNKLLYNIDFGAAWLALHSNGNLAMLPVLSLFLFCITCQLVLQQHGTVYSIWRRDSARLQDIHDQQVPVHRQQTIVTQCMVNCDCHITSSQMKLHGLLVVKL